MSNIITINPHSSQYLTYFPNFMIWGNIRIFNPTKEYLVNFDKPGSYEYEPYNVVESEAKKDNEQEYPIANNDSTNTEIFYLRSDGKYMVAHALLALCIYLYTEIESAGHIDDLLYIRSNDVYYEYYRINDEKRIHCEIDRRKLKY